MQGEAFRAAAAVGDQIDLVEAGPRIVPVGERADGDLLLEPAARVGRRGAAPRELRPSPLEQAGQGRATGLPHELVYGRGEVHFATLHEPVEQLGHEGLQPVGPDAPARLPEYGRRHLRPILARAAGAWAGCPRPRRPPQQPDGRLAVHASHCHHLVQQPVLLAPAGLLVPLALHGGVLSQAGSRHGGLRGRIGNRDF